ncbi:class I SAM-dependent methyltransferase [Streptomyces puniciscabiei]
MTDTADFLTATRTFYDTVAEDYAAHFGDHLGDKPLERALLRAFAELVGTAGIVADLGCGTGVATAYLASLGLDVFGLDLSESMLTVARREHPALRFEQGSMLELPLTDGSLAGAVSWYSSIHTPVGELPRLLAEFHRVLRPGGHLLLAFQTGDEPRRLAQPWGRPVTLDFERRRPEFMAGLLADGGFTLRSSTVRQRDAVQAESADQAFLLAQKEG